MEKNQKEAIIQHIRKELNYSGSDPVNALIDRITRKRKHDPWFMSHNNSGPSSSPKSPEPPVPAALPISPLKDMSPQNMMLPIKRRTKRTVSNSTDAPESKGLKKKEEMAMQRQKNEDASSVPTTDVFYQATAPMEMMQPVTTIYQRSYPVWQNPMVQVPYVPHLQNMPPHFLAMANNVVVQDAFSLDDSFHRGPEINVSPSDSNLMETAPMVLHDSDYGLPVQLGNDFDFMRQV